MSDRNHKVAVYVPTKVHDRLAASMHRHYRRIVLARFARMFGGGTAVPGVGVWVNSTGRTTAEKVAVCYSFCDSTALEKRRAAVFDLARLVAERMQQAAVGVELDGVLHLVRPDGVMVE